MKQNKVNTCCRKQKIQLFVQQPLKSRGGGVCNN